MKNDSNASERTDTDLLVSRVIGRDDGPEDWRRLRSCARSAPEVWLRLADGLEDDMCLRAAIAREPDVATSIALPRVRRRRMPRHAGWAAAAVFAVLWCAELRTPRETSPVASAPRVTERDAEPLGELPRVVVSTGEVADDGSVEVVYVRRLLERTRLSDVQTIGVDETGRPFRAEHSAALIAAPQSM